MGFGGLGVGVVGGTMVGETAFAKGPRSAT